MPFDMDSMSLTAFIQSGFAIFGFIALSIWLVKWVSHFTRKTQDLSDIDKQANEALRCALGDQLQFRDLDKKEFDSQLRKQIQKIKDIDSDLEEKQVTLDRHDRFIELIATANLLTYNNNKIFYEDAKKLDTSVKDILALALEVLKKSGADKETFKRLVESGINRTDPPEADEEKLLHYAFALVQDATAVRCMGSYNSSILMITLDEFIKNSKITSDELIKIAIEKLSDGTVQEHYAPNKALIPPIATESKAEQQ